MTRYLTETTIQLITHAKEIYIVFFLFWENIKLKKTGFIRHFFSKGGIPECENHSLTSQISFSLISKT